mmetsp:Transcript_22628/g.49669  ORF Transcript_22628/g.49669 Transcript_22628/m.49669 type:complete len:476 (-) Transcript_22628:253-1680(-)|eukprot:CAMPEP_0206445398 /NCGR_PEP_ID=MMETSP0324_2-20121206/15484_1 /ASSEMBLY_ACC=CAM_ASM_000836 /TAXON_ID=2866 /ORGANISM="Crypthecodinium cohnii, Strain Seligo" /LENGTH=475 /DNA_ID=CAMNT_0053913605 /DNA_START=31 /DNA_END=1458 /DNA_ORIENTATION=-
MAGGFDAGGSSGPKSDRSWPLWKLILIALPQLSVQVLWCFIGPNSASYMQHLGAPTALATLNNIAGPITGFFTGPLIGAISDSCTSRLGRRRPVILCGLASLWVAGMMFSGSELFFPEGKAIYFAAPMYWVMDVTINVLQTPHRALVSDLASEEQQVPMQVAFVFMMAVGNFVGFSIMQIYSVPVEHMFELMLGICLLNTFCVGVQFLVAREVPLPKNLAHRQSFCDPAKNVIRAVKDSPKLLYQLAAVQCLVWIGNTGWTLYSGQWIQTSVFEGVEKAPIYSAPRVAYEEGEVAFSVAGQWKSVLQLLSTLAIIGVLLNFKKLRPSLIYAPCIFVGAIVSVLAAFFVGQHRLFAMGTLAFSIMPETGSFAIPFGLVATLNKRAAQEGKKVSTALQMALLNCCVTVGQQICTLSLALVQMKLSFESSLPFVFMLAAVAQLFATGGALMLDDNPDVEERQLIGAEAYEDNSDSDSE